MRRVGVYPFFPLLLCRCLPHAFPPLSVPPFPCLLASSSRQACVDLMGNMERADYLGAFRDLGRLVRIGRCLPLPLAFGEEALLGMAVCGEIRKLWSAYAKLLGKTSVAVGGEGGSDGLDLSAVIQGIPPAELEKFQQGFGEEDEILDKLIGGLEALPATGQALPPLCPPPSLLSRPVESRLPSHLPSPFLFFVLCHLSTFSERDAHATFLPCSPFSCMYSFPFSPQPLTSI